MTIDVRCNKIPRLTLSQYSCTGAQDCQSPWVLTGSRDYWYRCLLLYIICVPTKESHLQWTEGALVNTVKMFRSQVFNKGKILMTRMVGVRVRVEI